MFLTLVTIRVNYAPRLWSGYLPTDKLSAALLSEQASR